MRESPSLKLIQGSTYSEAVTASTPGEKEAATEPYLVTLVFLSEVSPLKGAL